MDRSIRYLRSSGSVKKIKFRVCLERVCWKWCGMGVGGERTDVASQIVEIEWQPAKMAELNHIHANRLMISAEIII